MSPAKLPRKAVILGAGGFIGINLAHELAAQGFDIVCFDRAASPQWPNSAKVIEGDFYVLPQQLLQELDHSIVFHMISSCRPSSNTATAADEIDRDLVSTIHYLEATKGRDLRWVFLSSGGTVYGPKDDSPIDEASATAPICSYGAMKLAIERYLDLYHTLHATNFVTVRVANPYGPWQQPTKGQGIIAAMLYKALKGETMEIWGDGGNVRDYIYIHDTVLGIIAAATKGRTAEIYNVGTAHGVSINQLITLINETLGLKLNANYAAARDIDVKYNILSPAKLMSHTDWQPRTSMVDGLKATCAWLKQQQ